MIKISIETNGKKVADSLTKENTTLAEVGVGLYSLEQIKLKLLNLEFDDDVYILEEEDA